LKVRELLQLTRTPFHSAMLHPTDSVFDQTHARASVDAS